MNRNATVIVLTTALVAGVALGSAVLGRSSEPASTPPAATPSSPLAAYLGFGHHPDEEDAVYEREEARRQKVIQSCMASSGFDYYPRPPDQLASSTSRPDESAGDENEAYRATLSGSEARSYWMTLTGLPTEDGVLDGEAMAKYDTNSDGHLDRTERGAMGCIGAASAQIPGVFEIVGVLRSQLQQLDKTIATDPRSATAWDDWVSCLGEQGVVASSPRDASRQAADGTLSSTQSEAVANCNAQRSDVMQEVRLDAETEFYRANESVIRDLAYPYPYPSE